jgi:hypothetical protein
LDADAEVLDAAKKIVIAVDNDAPGRRLEDELARRLGRERCWRVEWPVGCKDANDVLVKFDAAELRAVMLRLPRTLSLDRRPLGEPDDRQHRTDPWDNHPEAGWSSRILRRVLP